jgi:chaperone modulatory protein CbpM
LTLAELSRCCDVPAERILVLVAEGVLTPSGRDQQSWRFDADDLIRAQSALRIQRDLGVNCAGAALAIDLMEDLQRMRERIRALEALVFRR